MEELDQEFINSVKKNYPKNKDKILAAYDLARLAHKGIVRKSGEPYIIHPVSVAKILIENNMDYSTVIAGLLHDVVEDTDVKLSDIRNQFGDIVAKLVSGMTKIDEITKQRNNLTEDDSIKRLLLAMGDDVRVIFIKLADRLHNMRTIQYLSRERQIRFANETNDLLIPIAERVGVRTIRTELQELTFECLHPDEYKEIKQEYDRRYNKHQDEIKAIEEKISSSLKKIGINAKVYTWKVQYHSLYKRLKSQGLSKARNLVLFRVVVPNEQDCYRALGVVNKEYSVVPSQIMDYIASPKPNGYQSLHTGLMTNNGSFAFSVMIRTPRMNKICEYGILAMWKNKDSDEEYDENLEKYNKLKSIVYGESLVQSKSSQFIDAIKTDLSSNVTWAFTPKLKPISIEVTNPTAIDFAYAVHTKIGNNAVAAIINGKKASIGATIKNGDVVEILLSNEDKAPSRNWLMVARSTVARRRIREYINRHTTPENIELGKSMLANELEKYGYTLSDLTNYYPEIKVDFGFSSIEDMYASIGYKSVTLNQISNYCLRDDERKNALKCAPIVVENITHANSLVFSKCCCPIVGDEIVAVQARGGISIHTKNCVNLRNFDASKILPAKWKNNIDRLFEVNIKVVAKDSLGFAAKLLSSISKLNVDISKIIAKKVNENDCQLEIGVKVKNNTELNKLISKIQTIDSVKSINRSFD